MKDGQIQCITKSGNSLFFNEFCVKRCAMDILSMVYLRYHSVKGDGISAEGK